MPQTTLFCIQLCGRHTVRKVVFLTLIIRIFRYFNMNDQAVLKAGTQTGDGNYALDFRQLQFGIENRIKTWKPYGKDEPETYAHAKRQ